MTMAETYEAIRYAADGHAGEASVWEGYTDGEVVERGTLEAVRTAVAQCLPEGRPSMDRLRWSGADGDVEAYHESDDEGCGGWVIRPA